VFHEITYFSNLCDNVDCELPQEVLSSDGYEVAAHKSALEALKQDLSGGDLLTAVIRMDGL